jgi:hypothetical protein
MRVADVRRQVEDNRYRQAVVLTGQRDQRSAGLGLHIGGINHRQSPRGQALGRDEMEDLEGLRCGRLRRFGVRNQGAACIRRQHLGRLKMSPGEGGFPRPGGADEDNQCQFWNRQVYRVKIPIWVGEPTCGSSGPIAAKSTV